VRIALMIEGQEGVSWEQWVALADTCEEHGIETLFRSDHYLSQGDDGGRDALDAWTTLAGLAARTTHLRLGTLVSPVTFRPAAVLAKSAVSVDHISGGRVEVGMGAGWMEAEHRAYGFPFPDTKERLRLLSEQLETVRSHWSEDGGAFPKPVQKPHPPLIVGGSGGRGTTEPAARFADEYNTLLADPDECARRRRRLDAACERVGRDPVTMRFSLMTGCLVGRDASELRERARRLLVRRGEQDGDADALVARYRERGVAGTPDEVAERLRELEEAGRVERVMLQHLQHDDLEMVAMIGREVVPKLAA
jgi:alkanesulfonate monooxygenase SsuD/methylene tetrahydromethanopterin reductase-like flavin-dependent oxidoreductase (luciferase family)